MREKKAFSTHDYTIKKVVFFNIGKYNTGCSKSPWHVLKLNIKSSNSRIGVRFGVKCFSWFKVFFKQIKIISYRL